VMGRGHWWAQMCLTSL